jgi:uncharacterized membrane protein (DUF485 family)
MRAQARPKSLVLPLVEKKTGWKAQTGNNIPFVQTKKSRFLLALTSLTWIFAAFVSIAFYIAVRSNRAETEWLAALLLGMLILGWIMVALYFREGNKPVQPTGRGDLHE